MPKSDPAVLLRRYHRTREAAIRVELVERFLPLARSVAGRLADRDEPLDDLVQVASIGLIKAIDNFEPSRGHAFPTYAVPTIYGELRRYLRDRSWTVRPPRGMQDRALKVTRVVAQLTSQLGRPPTVGEVAARLSVSDAEVLDAMLAMRARRAASLQAPLRDDGSETLEDQLGDPDPELARVEHRLALDRACGRLTGRERLVLRLRFEHDMTQSAIAGAIGLSQMTVCRVLRTALRKLEVMDDGALRPAG